MSTQRDYIVSTGDHIEGWLDDHEITQAELARRLGVTAKHVSELCSGKASLTQSLALKLEQVTGTPADIWMRIETSYRQALAKAEQIQQYRQEIRFVDIFPLAYMRRHGLLRSTKRQGELLVSELCSFLRVATLENFQKNWQINQRLAFRKSSQAQEETAKLAVWLRVGELQHETAITLDEYNSQKLRDCLSALRGLTCLPLEEGFNKARELLEGCGVRLCYTPAISGLRVHGCTRWLLGQPIIQLSGYLKTDDQMWFTLFHEIGHILCHEKGTYINEGIPLANEKDADDFAVSTLFPQGFIDDLPSTRNIAKIEAIASKYQLPPGIVLAQTQRITGDYKWGHQLQQKLNFPEMIPSITV